MMAAYITAPRFCWIGLFDVKRGEMWHLDKMDEPR